MVGRILIVLDGAPEPVRTGVPTTLEAACTPALDDVCAQGAVSRLRTTPEGLEPGSETGIPTLLGAPPASPVARGPIEAAAARVEVPPGTKAWRVDIRHLDGRRAEARPALSKVGERMPAHRVTALRAHRLLAVGPDRPTPGRVGELCLEVWPDGADLEPVLDTGTVVICGPGAAAGCARLLGASVQVLPGATGDVDTDLPAKARSARGALEAGRDVVVHVGALDEAAHRRDRHAKREALERTDALLIAPLVAVARRRGAILAVTSDHSTCPRTGRHGAEPVPLVAWGPDVPRHGPDRLTERATASEGVADSPWAAAWGAVA